MSKLRDIAKRKESIKSTISGLALMLAIGGMGSFGSYAYFTAQAKVDNSLKVNMATMGISVDSGINAPNVELNPKGTEVTETFVVTNTGELDQYIKAGITVDRDNTDFTSEELEKIKYELYIVANDDYGISKDTLLFKSTLDENKELSFLNIGKNKLRLNVGKPLELKAKVIIDEDIKGSSCRAKNIKFYLNVEGSQINAE